MWGTRLCLPGGPGCPRFTPTHVGNTFEFDPGQQRWSVHPHACGEHSITDLTYIDPSGSPPRMWGTRKYNPSQLSLCRFTPTHVGNTCRAASSGHPAAVHPHACGEHHDVVSLFPVDDGSPPRMWGTQAHVDLTVYCIRFTPTHVGNTPVVCVCGCRHPVHPHACGEHLSTNSSRVLPPGSPPRMWGTPQRQRCRARCARFTPTHVGNTIRVAADSAASTVHPHACGEHSWRQSSVAIQTGSPPRMWGTLRIVTLNSDFLRFTPTHVGNTLFL